MNLVVDIGNSSAKYAVFDGSRCVFHCSAAVFDQRVEDCLNGFHPERALVAAVAPVPQDLLSGLARLQCAVTELSVDTPMPLNIAYESPKTLGVDRLAAAVGAWKQFQQRDLLVVDMGSCITYDLVTRDATYRGGNIAPGMRMRFRSMHDGTARLPELEWHGETLTPFGHDTASALQGGVVWGILQEMEGYLRKCQQTMPEVQVVVTGGDGALLCPKDDDRFIYDELLVARGLNEILEYNYVR